MGLSMTKFTKKFGWFCAENVQRNNQRNNYDTTCSRLFYLTWSSSKSSKIEPEIIDPTTSIVVSKIPTETFQHDIVALLRGFSALDLRLKIPGGIRKIPLYHHYINRCPWYDWVYTPYVYYIYTYIIHINTKSRWLFETQPYSDYLLWILVILEVPFGFMVPFDRLICHSKPNFIWVCLKIVYP